MGGTGRGRSTPRIRTGTRPPTAGASTAASGRPPSPAPGPARAAGRRRRRGVWRLGGAAARVVLPEHLDRELLVRLVLAALDRGHRVLRQFRRARERLLGLLALRVRLRLVLRVVDLLVGELLDQLLGLLPLELRGVLGRLLRQPRVVLVVQSLALLQR